MNSVANNQEYQFVLDFFHMKNPHAKVISIVSEELTETDFVDKQIVFILKVIDDNKTYHVDVKYHLVGNFDGDVAEYEYIELTWTLWDSMYKKHRINYPAVMRRVIGSLGINDIEEFYLEDKLVNPLTA